MPFLANIEFCSKFVEYALIEAYLGITYCSIWSHNQTFGTLCNPCIYNNAIFRTQAYSEPWHSQDSLFTEAFLRIFRDIQRCWCILSLAHRHATSGQGGWRERKSPLPFLKMKNSVLILRQRGFDFVHFWLKFSIQNAVLIVSGRETPKCFPFGPHFLLLLTKCLLKCLSSTPPTALKNFWLRTCIQALFFLQNAPS